MNYRQYSATRRKRIEKKLSSFFAAKQKERTPIRFHKDVLNRLLEFSSAGKLMRGIFIFAAYEMCGGKERNDVLNAACAMEIAHAGLLIHDDIMDQDKLRRGLRTVYTQYEDVARKSRLHNASLYGESLGICAGDIAFFLSMELLAQSAIDPLILKNLTKLFSLEMVRLGVAQMEDVHLGNQYATPSRREVLQMYLYKSARYSFSLPFQMGAILAGAPRPICNRIALLGEQIGIIFQIKDDEIGLFGTSKTIGKTIGIDIRSNKKTLHRYYLLKHARPQEQKRLLTIFGNDKTTDSDIQYVMGLMKTYNIQSRVRSLLAPYEKKAYDIIRTFDAQHLDTTMLKGIVELNMTRTT